MIPYKLTKKQAMIIEIGHFYIDEETPNVNYLYDMVKYFPANSRKVLFVDDFHPDTCRLNVTGLKELCEEILSTQVDVVYESEMLDLYQQTLSLFNPEDLMLQKYRKSGTVKQDLVIDGQIFTLATVSPTFKPSCLMLSLIWSLERLKQGPTMTLIDEKYYGIEEKVLQLISYLDYNRKTSLRDKVHLMVI